eukprot:660475-Alexandrium_andersonii.AAC.1
MAHAAGPARRAGWPRRGESGARPAEQHVPRAHGRPGSAASWVLAAWSAAFRSRPSSAASPARA